MPLLLWRTVALLLTQLTQHLTIWLQCTNMLDEKHYDAETCIDVENPDVLPFLSGGSKSLNVK